MGMDLDRRQFHALGLGSLFGAAPDSSSKVLRFGWWGGAGRHEVTLKAIALFEQHNPGVKVKAEYMGFNGYLERLTTQIAGGSEADVMQINWAWLAMFSKHGNGFTDLDKYRSLLSLDQFSAEDLQSGRVQGKLNALPTAYTARVMLWNQATFDRAGVPLPKTWDDLFAAGPLFKARLGDMAYPLDGELYDMILLSQAYVQQKYGTPYVDPLEARVAMSYEAATEWVQTYQRLVQNHVATWVVGNWAGNFTWDSVIPLRAATLNKEQKLVLGDFPMLPGSKVSGMFGRPTMMLAMGRNCKQPELAARFINFLLTDPQAAAILGKTRGVPAARVPLELLVQSKRLPPMELAAHQQISAQRIAGRVPVPAPLFEHARLHKFMREVFETIAYGKTSERDAVRRLIDDGNALLKRIK